jgi:hypothetical protein
MLSVLENQALDSLLGVGFSNSSSSFHGKSLSSNGFFAISQKMLLLNTTLATLIVPLINDFSIN